MLYRVFKEWRFTVKIRQKAEFAMLKRRYKLLALAFFTIKSSCQDSTYFSRKQKRARLMRL
jgi:hypothetical protein